MSDQVPMILVVDDDAVLRRLVARSIERLDCGQVLEVSDGLEAKRVLEEREVDLVVTDVVMPQLDGLGLMRWAKEHRPEASWIILSGLDTFDAAVEAIQLGAFDFLVKPPEVERLRLAVRNALEHRLLVRERERLYGEVERSNRELRIKVDQLEQLCGILEDQADVIQQDLERAEVIQRSLLPRAPPPMYGYGVETLYRPGRNVGGDLYDVAALDDRYVVLLIADASGHGVSAAMLSVLFKHHLRMLDEETGAPVPPASALAAVNRCLLEEVTAPGMFITAAYCLLDTKEGELRVASAGHPPLLCAGPRGAIRRIERTGPALGVDREGRFDERRLRLERGDRLLLFTDGVLEGGWVGPNLERIAEALRREATSGRDILQGLHAGASSAADAADRDDITMILVEAGAGSSHFDAGIEREEAAPPSAHAPRAEITTAEAPEGIFVRIAGKGTWTSSTAFHAFAQRSVAAGRPLTLDLAGCSHLDSTFLGTVHEIVSSARDTGSELRLQRVPPPLRALFEELSMSLVLGSIRDAALTLPEPMKPLERAGQDAESHRRVLRAHEVLASLSEQNREEFRAVIENLRSELGGAPGVSGKGRR